MSNLKTKIQWTDATWSPVTGCTKVSPGCAHCYIDRTTPFRMAGRKFVHGHIPLIFHHNRIAQPSRWKRPRMIFVNSLSDLFHPDVPFHFIDDVVFAMKSASQHTYQVLTKRPERMLEWAFSTNARFGDLLGAHTGAFNPPWHIWWGVTVESRRWRSRIAQLRQFPAAIRFVSFEPLLEDVSDGLDLSGIDWAIWGGESGPGARPCALEWIERGVEVCRRKSVAPFVKQLGSCVVSEERACATAAEAFQQFGVRSRWLWAAGLKDKKGGDIAEFPETLRIREYPSLVPA